MKLVLTAVAFVVAVGDAWGVQDSEQDLVRKAQDRAQEAQAKAQEMKPDKEQEDKLKQEALKEKAEAAYEKTRNIPDKDPFIAFFWKDGLKFKAGDVVEGALAGRFYFVYRNIFDRHEGTNGSSPDTFVIDSARIMLDLTLYQDWQARVEMEFSKGTRTSGNSDKSFFLKDGYIGWKAIPEVNVKLGQMKEPFGQEHTCSSRFIEFGERSLVDQIVPQHDIGILFSGSLWEKVFTYELGFFNGSQAGSGRNGPDDSEEKDVALRARVFPWINSEGSILKNFRAGIAAVIGDVDSTSLRDFTTADYGNMTIIDFTGTEDGRRVRLGFELTWNINQFGIRAEIVHMNQELTNDDDFDTLGWYIQGSWNITGEAQPMENRIKPTNPFSPSEGKWGAFQLALRICQIDAEDAEDAGAIASALNQKVLQLGLALNWWPTSFFRVTMDIEHFTFDEDVRTGADDEDSQTVLYFRFSFDW